MFSTERTTNPVINGCSAHGMKSHFPITIRGVFLYIILVIFLLWPLQIKSQTESQPLENLHLSVLKGNTEMVRKHIDAGSDINQKDQFGSTPLIIAATFGRNDIAELLIKAGAELNLRSGDGSTALQIASLLCRIDIVRDLIANGADRSIRNNSGLTAYDLVAVPFENDKNIYDRLAAGLGPLGLNLDYEKIKKLRPEIAGMLTPGEEELKTVTYTPFPGKDWALSTPVDEGLNPELVARLYYDADELETIYGLLLIKNDKLIAENYFNEGSIDQLAKRASVTKSYVSALTGIALNKGCLKSIDQKMIDFFPELSGKLTDTRKKEITIREMLQMRTGFPWEETDTSYWNAVWSRKYLRYIADFPLTGDPGTVFNYSNLTSHWLGIIVARVCNTDLLSFGMTNLFGPLGVKPGDWNRDLDGYYIGGGDIEFTARDMAKFGLLYLNSGKYSGKEIIPSHWVNESLQTYSNIKDAVGVESGKLGRYFENIGYGYQWWSASVGDHNFNFAWGHGGQLIILLPDQNMVIVTTADPFWGKEKHFQSWKYEKSIINVVGKFIKSLPVGK